MATRSIKKEPEDKLDKEIENLFKYRLDRFRKVFPEGWPERDIEKLAKSDSHPSQAEKLNAQGCPPKLIVKILG